MMRMMKNSGLRRVLIEMIIVCLCGIATVGCGEKSTIPSENTVLLEEPDFETKSEPENGADTDALDLTALSSTMVYAEVYQMMTAPEDYVGWTVTMEGQFSVYHDTVTDQYYYAVMIADATACCQQGMEFVLSGDYTYPDDYPIEGTEVKVTGVFETYYEDEVLYCHLMDSKMEF